MERHLAAILAADVVGYSALMERDETDFCAAEGRSQATSKAPSGSTCTLSDDSGTFVDVLDHSDEWGDSRVDSDTEGAIISDSGRTTGLSGGRRYQQGWQ
jgi:hypothetical protein